MAILGNIRSKAGNTFVAVAISFLVVMFLGSDLSRLFAHFFSDKNKIGTVAGEPISYRDYRKFYEVAMYHNFESQGKRPTAEEQLRLKDYAWRQLIEDILYAKEIKQADMVVGNHELIDLVQGEHIDASLMAFFKNPETAAFDKQRLLTYLKNLSKGKQERWCQFEKELALRRAREKLHQCMLQSYFVTASEEEQTTQRASTFCDVDYLYIPFTSVSDDLVAPTRQQLQDFMVAHSNHYKALSESKTIKYITVPIQPDEKDSTDFQKELNSLVVQFSTVTDPYTFAKQHTDGSLADTSLTCVADALPDPLAKIKHTLKQGMVVGPVVQEGFHTLYKVIQEAQGTYQIAVIQKKLVISDHTRNKRLRDLHHLAAQVKTLADLEALAANQQLTIHQEEVVPSDASIGAHAAAREVVRWLYNEATIGKVSNIFDLGDGYLLAVMIDQVKAGGLLPLHSVFNKVYYKVLNQAKAKIILDKLKQIPSTTLQGIAEQYGNHIAVKSVERLNFLENDDKYLRQAKAFIGKCFGLPPNVISNPIIDDEGIFIVCVKSKYSTENLEKPNERFKQVERWMQSYYVVKSLEELVKVTDERYKIE